MTGIKITLRIPGTDDAGQYFSLRLKNALSKESVEYYAGAKTLVVSNVGGNFRSLCKLLIKNGVINERLDWTFDDGHLVIIGSCLGSKECVLECMWLIYSLEEKARKPGGYVHFILGEQDIIHLNGDWRFSHPGYARRNKSARSSSTALYDGNNELWRWLCTKNIIEKVGDVIFASGIVTCQLTKSDMLRAILEEWRASSIVTVCSGGQNIESFFNGRMISINTNFFDGNAYALLIEKEKIYNVDIRGQKLREVGQFG